MAKPSKGVPLVGRGIDANQIVALLDTVHHWSCTRINREDGVPGMEVTITHAGRRVTCQRRTFVDAANAALNELQYGKPGVLKLTR